jgi:subtilisin family serine protease
VGDGEGITVYVLDTGIDKRNKQFKDVIVRAFRDDKIDFDDKNGHGTLVAGLIAGQQTGVARKATLISYKLLDDDGVTSAAALHNALCEIDEKTNYANGPKR